MAIAIFRINYKSDFILTLNNDAGWATPFCIKFWTGAPSQAYFAGYDGTTYTHCAPVEGEPTKLRVQFDDHHLPIGDLKFQIGYHFTVADFPTSVEDEVLNQASVIIEVDDAPAQVMLDFNGETAPEIEFSLPAYANEAQRIANEQQRIENEQARISAENERISNEDARIAEEQVRVSQEATRVSEFAQLKEESQEATGNANAAAALANEKAQLAADKAALADDASTLANDKAALAQQKAAYAQEQGDYAKAQGDIAQADHQRAESDHTTATADHTQAAADHSQADADHNRAESDHEAVEAYVDSLGAFDISAYHATGGVQAKYADLAAALGTGGANIPDDLRKGGMSVKFIQSSDNKYVQYFCNSQTFTTDVVYWEKINLEKDLCKEYAITEIKDGYWQHIGVGTENQNNNYFIAKGFIVNGYSKLLVSQSVGSGDGAMGIVFYKENGDFVSGVNLTSEKTIDIPSNAHHANITFKKEVYENMGRFVFHLYNDIGGLVSEINSIASEVDGITFNNSVSTTNLIPLLDSEKVSGKGMDANGVLVNTSWTKMSSRFIEVIPGSYIQYRLRGISGLVIAFYTASNESSYISNSGVASGTAYIAGTVKVPSTAKYMRFCSTDWSNECYIYTNNIATVNFIGALDKRDVCLLHANIVDGYYINSVNGITAASLYGYYELPVIPKETIILYGGVETGSNTIVLGYYLDDILVTTENLSNHYKQKCTFIVPDGVNNVKVSFNEEEKTNLYFMHDYSSLIKGDNFLSYKVGLIISANNAITQSSAPFCNITKSDGVKVSGTGTTTITLTLADTLANGTIMSLGVKYPYSTQEVATVSVDGGNAIDKAGTTQKTKSGLMFKMQGEAYQRINIKYHAQTIDIVVTTTETTDDWELWISDCVIVNDIMPLAPVCYIYDGGHWDGHVMYNNESISIWTLHRRLGIPYSIAATSPSDTYQQEVLDDIESGFAEIITRIGGRDNTLYKQDDADVIEGIMTECRDHEADNMGAVLATHAFDKDVLRCVKMSGVEFLRTYPTYDNVEKYGSRFGDYDLPLISGHSVSSTTLVPESFMGFPVILWAHGVGDPQSAAEQELSDFYEDKTNGSHLAGASTISAMTKILNAQAVGNAAAMKASDYIAFCKKYQ